VGDLVRERHHGSERPAVIVARTTQRVGDAIERLQRYGISQMPVSEAAEGVELAGLVGSITERGLLDRAYRDPSVVDRTVGEVMGRAIPEIDEGATLDEAFALLSGDVAAVLATRDSTALGVITKLDLLEHLAHHAPAGD
jgi:cystathionine beta-synthase